MLLEMPKTSKNKPPSISVIIPSYNMEKYISQTIESIIYQNYPNLEVLVQDGNSTDRTMEIVRKFAQKYSFIKWESKNDKGQCDAINLGMKKAVGEILTYINADDVYEKNAFRKIATAYQKNPEDLWFAGQGRVVDGNRTEIVKPVTHFKNLLLKLNKYTLLLVVNYLMQPSVFFTRRAYESYGPFTGGTFVMEYDFWLKLGKRKMPIIIPETISSFRLTAGSITSSQTKKLLDLDYKIVRKYTHNKIIIFLHWVGILGRKIILKII